MILNLLHYIPERRALTLDTIEDKIPLYNQQIELDLCVIRNKTNLDHLIIKQVNQVKSNQTLSFEIVEDKVIFTVPEIDGYEVITMNYE